MPRPMLNTKTDTQTGQAVRTMQKATLKTEPRLVRNTLKKKRSQEYVDTLSKLDAHTGVKFKTQDMVDAIVGEFEEINLDGFLLGYVSKCYLGEDYEVHTLTMTLNIIEHYRKGQKLPDGLEKARSLARNPNYAFIEVYIDRCIAIDKSGNPSEIMG